MINEDLKDEIKNRIKLSEIISQKVNLKRKTDDTFLGLCPFHNEKTPSFNVNDSKGFYHCFGCQRHGDIFNFVMEYENINFLESLKYLADKVGLTINNYNLKINNKISRKMKILDLTTSFFIEQLKTDNSFKIKSYLKNRFIDEKICQEFSIGFAPKKYDKNNLLKFLFKNGFSIEEIVSVGLAKKNNNDFVSYFNNRIMIPITSVSGKVVGFGGRVFEEGLPKYLNSPENEIFSKRNLLFGVYNFKKNFKKSNYIILCEGYMDVILLFRYGFPAVASLGTAVSENQINMLTSLSKNIFIVFDGDKAGKDATLRIFDKILSIIKAGLNFKFTFIPNGFDPEEYLKNHGEDSFKNLLEKSYSISDMIWLMGLKNKTDNTPETIAKFWQFVRKKVYQVKDRNLHIAIKDELENRISEFRNIKKQANYNNKDFINIKLPSIEKNLRFKAVLSILFNFPELYFEFEEDLKNINFVNNGLHELKEVIFSNIIAYPEITKIKLNEVFKERKINNSIENLELEKIFSKLLLSIDDISLEKSKKILGELIFMIKRSS